MLSSSFRLWKRVRVWKWTMARAATAMATVTKKTIAWKRVMVRAAGVIATATRVAGDDNGNEVDDDKDRQ